MKEGKGTYHILSHTNSIQSYKNYSIGRDLKKAIENNELEFYIQPRVDTTTKQITGAEALIRCRHPKWGLLLPGEFINIAKENGLITDLDNLPFDGKNNTRQKKTSSFYFHCPLEAKLKISSIAKRNLDIGVSKVLVTEIGAGGLRFISNLNLPIRTDILYQFITELLRESILLNAKIVWKEEVNEDLAEYGVKFIFENDEERAKFTTILDTLAKNHKKVPPYKRAIVDDINEYFNIVVIN
ncbi:PilZ domain-containing protein [Ureibacillus sp. FSL W8-0352]|uniref:PilZ domain-containing protein n=1 Tax=Ureibacillus sp. FSL W8-0352 TaxID=2954596 RepID=UPI0030F7B6E8